MKTTAAGAMGAGTAFVCAMLAAASAQAADAPKAGVKTEYFNKDPGWEGRNNRITPANVPTVTQDFGYGAGNFAGKEKGEIGGRIQRLTAPAQYADKIAVKTLDDKLSASGSFAVTATGAGAGLFFGWFNADQQPGSGRPVGSLGLNFDAETSGGRLAVRLITGGNKSCGTFITPFVPGGYRPTPIRNDGTRYAFTLDYDPAAAGGNGRFRFVLKSNSPKPEAFEGKEFTVDLPPGYRKENAAFDRFGIINMMKAGSAMTIHFDDLRYDGKAEDFAKDPGWVGVGNRTTFQDKDQVGAHDFGFSEKTRLAGGAGAGELGGNFWRSGKYGSYADKVGPFTLDDRLEASGSVVLKVGAPDSDMYLGWFAGGDKEKEPADSGHFVGVHIGGPTRVGHYFAPALTTAKGTRAKVDKAPVLLPGKVFDWKLVYDPAAGGGKGAVTVTLGDETVMLQLKAGHRAEGVRLDRFGVFTSTAGGQLVRIYFDDLRYTAGR